MLRRLYHRGQNEPKSLSIKEEAFWFYDQRMLRGDAGAGGAHVSAGTAVLALGGVDDVETVSFGDGVLGAFGFASAAADAIGRDLVSHISSFQWLFGTYKGIG